MTPETPSEEDIAQGDPMLAEAEARTRTILDTLLVDGELGRQGIAKSLMEQLLKNLHALRISCLRTEVAWDQVDLISFFGKVGFRPAHRLVLDSEARFEGLTCEAVAQRALDGIASPG